MTEFFYIDEVQNRPDGQSNLATTVTRATLGNALAYYYERHSKLAPSTTFTSYCLGVRSNLGRVIEPWQEYECTEYVATTE